MDQIDPKTGCTIRDEKPPVVTGHDERWQEPPKDNASAPDGISGNWK